MQKLYFLLFLLSVTGSVYARQTAPAEDSLAGFRYVERVQHAVSAKDKLPVLIAFHFSGGRPAETLADYDDLKTPVRIIIPRGNFPKREGFSYFPVDYYRKDSAAQVGLSRVTLDSVAAFVRAVEAKYGTKAVVSGISQGGDLAWLMAVYYPGLCKAAFAFAAYIHTLRFREILEMPANKVPINIYQGDDDPIISVHYTRAAVRQLSGKLLLTLTTYPGLKHDISAEMKKDYSRELDKVLARW